MPPTYGVSSNLRSYGLRSAAFGCIAMCGSVEVYARKNGFSFDCAMKARASASMRSGAKIDSARVFGSLPSRVTLSALRQRCVG